MHLITMPEYHDGRPFEQGFHPVDFRKAGLITSDDMHRTMIQPLKQGVRLTVLFDNLCDTSPLKTPYIYSAAAMLEEADFSSSNSSKATRAVLAQFASLAGTDLRSITSSILSKKLSSQDYGLENLIKATKTSPADVIVIYTCKNSTTDFSDFRVNAWSTALSFLKAYTSNRRGSYAQILSMMEAQVPSSIGISPRLSCSHPLGMCNLRWM